MIDGLHIPEFDEATHTYKINGVPAPGVTSIISSVLGPNPYWTQGGRDFGSAVHKAIHYYSEGDLDLDSLDDLIKPKLEAYIRFTEDHNFAPDLIEQPLYHPTMKYCGTLDQVQVGQCVIDYKNGQKLPQYAIQLSAYTSMLPNPLQYERWCVFLLSTGKYDLVVYKKQDLRNDFNYFQSFLNTYNWKEKHGSRTQAG